VERILIVRLSAIGDVIHALPVLHALRVAKPQAFIGWAVEEPSAELLRGHPELNFLHVIPKRRWRRVSLRSAREEMIPFFRELRSKRYEIAIDVQGLTKSGLVAWLSGARQRIGFGDKDGRELNKIFTNRKVVPLPALSHVIERNLSLLQSCLPDRQVLGIGSGDELAGTAGPPARAGIEFVLPLTEEHGRFAEDFLQRQGIEKPVALNPGAGWVTKRWQLERFGQLAVRIRKELKRDVLVCWGPGEEGMAQEVARLAERDGAKVFLAPPTGLLQLGALLKRCAAFVGGDTAPTHLAAAVGTPVVSFFGASDARRNAPWGAQKSAIQKTHLPCVPCWKTKCPLSGEDYLRCMKEISVEDIFNALVQYLR
jgi:heptosyltransferase-1